MIAYSIHAPRMESRLPVFDLTEDEAEVASRDIEAFADYVNANGIDLENLTR